ncbi:unnamed protein product [Pleuronectes platessa]|uniref:Uncharacterized protein n=1 Tax=Pleuronectes platessa TaxID=8262 RepID=A0A9N7UAC1_PLEPL|nr:unnamed protein product [Pleuronectes platessa]
MGERDCTETEGKGSYKGNMLKDTCFSEQCARQLVCAVLQQPCGNAGKRHRIPLQLSTSIKSHRVVQDSRAEQSSGAGRNLSPTINSGISFPSSGSQRGHSEGRRGRETGTEEERNRERDREGGPQSEITLLIEASPSVKTVPCVIGQRAPWQWHRPGFGEKISPPLVLWGSSGKLSWDLFGPAGWHGARCLSEKSPGRKHTLHG